MSMAGPLRAVTAVFVASQSACFDTSSPDPLNDLPSIKLTFMASIAGVGARASAKCRGLSNELRHSGTRTKSANPESREYWARFRVRASRAPE
jgi:hypothetical protein